MSYKTRSVHAIVYFVFRVEIPNYLLSAMFCLLRTFENLRGFLKTIVLLITHFVCDIIEDILIKSVESEITLLIVCFA